MKTEIKIWISDAVCGFFTQQKISEFDPAWHEIPRNSSWRIIRGIVPEE
jgi:hypothetical protein